jgi:predicted lipoprotein
VRLHYELDINLEGIETIFHLLDRIEALQQEMRDLQKKIGVYE